MKIPRSHILLLEQVSSPRYTVDARGWTCARSESCSGSDRRSINYKVLIFCRWRTIRCMPNGSKHCVHIDLCGETQVRDTSQCVCVFMSVRACVYVYVLNSALPGFSMALSVNSWSHIVPRKAYKSLQDTLTLCPLGQMTHNVLNKRYSVWDARQIRLSADWIR